MWVFTRVLDRLDTRRDMRAARSAASDYEIKTSLDYKTYEPNFFIRVRTFRTGEPFYDLTEFSVVVFII